MAGNLTGQVRNIAEVTTAVANGDLSKKITVDVRGEILQLKDTINTMVDQLRSFASEVTRVAREVGTEGKLGGQADVRGVAGTWKDLTDSVNSMAGNLTGQVRNIAEVTTAVANGDLSKKITVDVKGEILELKNTINTMVDQLSSFAAESASSSALVFPPSAAASCAKPTARASPGSSRSSTATPSATAKGCARRPCCATWRGGGRGSIRGRALSRSQPRRGGTRRSGGCHPFGVQMGSGRIPGADAPG